MPKVIKKPRGSDPPVAKKRGRPPVIPPPYPPPPPPPPPPVNNPYYQKFFEEYWKKYATGYHRTNTPGIPPPPPGAPFAKLPTVVAPTLPPMAPKVAPPPAAAKQPATRTPHGLHQEEYPINTDRRTFVLARPNDAEYLSEKQCYVRTRMAEIFLSEQTDVEKLVRGRRAQFAGQVGIRCVFCVPALDPKHRIERAICYPTTTAKFYQTAQDMQHFHWNSCPAIPRHVKEVYTTLKSNMNKQRVGSGSSTQGDGEEGGRKMSPKEFWAECCKELGLVDHIGDDGSNAGVKLREDHGLVERAKLPEYAKELYMPPSEKGKKEEGKKEEEEDDEDAMDEDDKVEEDAEMKQVLEKEVKAEEGENSGGFDELVADLDGDDAKNEGDDDDGDAEGGEEEDGDDDQDGDHDGEGDNDVEGDDGEDC